MTRIAHAEHWVKTDGDENRLEAVSDLADAVEATNALIAAFTLVGTLARACTLFGGFAAAPCRATPEANLLLGFTGGALGVVALRTRDCH